MSTLKVSSLLALGMVLTAVTTVGILAKSTMDEGAFTIRKVEEQVVLYTIHRGSYDKGGVTIGGLFALAGQKGITARGPVTFVYLNNPQHVSSKHWLTEIRIPMDKEALKLAGTLGEMTDVKALPAMDVVVATKPEGQADPGPIYESLTAWVFKEGYVGTDGPWETFLTNPTTGNYAQMKTEIMMPIEKLTPHKE